MVMRSILKSNFHLTFAQKYSLGTVVFAETVKPRSFNKTTVCKVAGRLEKPIKASAGRASRVCAI